MRMRYPIGIQSFEKIRQAGYVYVDKTDLIYKIVQAGQYFFLSRPRRFGKSLLISTMEAYFKGRKNLFSGLAVESLEKDWTEYPVLHLDFSGKSYSQEDVVAKVLDNELCRWEKEYGCENRSDIPGIRFGNVIEAAFSKTGRQVVILVDEYDKPVIDNLGRPDLLDKFREELQGFYSVMKSKDAFIRFGFLTGVTKIGKMSVFSGLNNLKDISMDSRYVDICGISETDLTKYFQESVGKLAAANNLSEEDCRQKLALMYDGYHFCEDSVGIYNPFSLLNTFDALKFKEYWFETGTPSFLVEVMRRTSYDVTRLSSDQVGSSLLTDVNTAFLNPVPLLYQSGYLTIKGYDPRYNLYTLGFPNREVKDGFLNFLLGYYAPLESESSNALVALMSQDVDAGNPESFLNRLDALFAKTSYQIQGDCEKDFQYAMYIILELMGEYVEVERATSNGRIDVLIQTAAYIYIIEIKTDSTPDEALAQIEEKGYARPFADDARRLFKIGVNFSTVNRRIDGWKVV